MRVVKPLLIAMLGVACVAGGSLGGAMLVVWGVLLLLPEQQRDSLRRQGQPWPAREVLTEHEDGVQLADLSIASRIRAWSVATVLLIALIVSLGALAVYIAGHGSTAGLVASATVAVVAAQALYRIEPRNHPD